MQADFCTWRVCLCVSFGEGCSVHLGTDFVVYVRALNQQIALAHSERVDFLAAKTNFGYNTTGSEYETHDEL